MLHCHRGRLAVPSRSLLLVGVAGGNETDLFLAELDLKHIAGLQTELGGVGVAHQQIAVALHRGHVAEAAAPLAGTGHTLAEADALGLKQRLVESGEVEPFGASKSDLVRAAGYVSTKKDGTERLNFTAFYEALLEAKGVSLSQGVARAGKRGRSLSYVATVQGNGNLLVGNAYTAQLGLKPGDVFEIKLGKKQIRLVPAGDTDEEE